MTPAAKCVLAAAVAMLTCWSPQAGRSANLTCGDLFTATSRVITLAGTATTSSRTPVDLPGATFSFSPGNRCLVVEVSGQVRAAGPNAMRLSVVVDGDVVEGPFPAFRDVYTQTAYDGRSVAFWVELDSGDKDVKVQFMSVNGSPVSLTKGVVIIKYTPGA